MQKDCISQEKESICFYEGPYASLSNFSAHQVEFEGSSYMTAEHAYQVAKFQDVLLREKIRLAPSAYLAREYGQEETGRTEAFQKRAVMKSIMRAKCQQHSDVRGLLLSTDKKEIIKNHPLDSYWGSGSNGAGENVMGKIWMEIRSEYEQE